MADFLSSEFWNNRYHEGQIGWDLGTISPPIHAYVEQLTDTNSRILIPGCGNAWEAEYLFRKGFKNVHILDFAQAPLDNFKARNPDFPIDQMQCDDFFEHKEKYDLIIEQTLYCAIDPLLRNDYARKSAELLDTGGKLVGVLFNRTFDSGPPFGGSKEEYLECFAPYFKSCSMEICDNSAAPRSGNELFIRLIK
jgi:methyl halide transferase